MSAASAPSQKICTSCGVDCAGKPRVKDQSGHYFCQPCFDRIEAKAKTAPAAPKKASPPPPDRAPAAGDDDGLIALMQDLPTVPVAAAPPSRCAECGMPMGASAKVCTNCGYNAATGKKIQVGVGEEIVDDKKPAKGSKAYKSSREHDADESKHQKKMAYLKPGITLAVCLGIVVAIAASKELSLPIYLSLLGIQAVATFIVYLGIAVAWVGFDEPFHIEFLRISAVTAVAAVPYTALVGVPIGWGADMIVWGIFLMAMMIIMELEIDEAVIVGFVGGLVNFIVAWIALPYLLEMF